MRHFEIRNKPFGENNGWRKNALVHCHKCGQDTFLPVQASGGGLMPDEVIHKKFMEAGWALSKEGGHDVCPECLKKTPAIRTSSMTTPKVEHVRIATGHVVDAPKEMSRDDRRLIYAQLEEVYVDERTGYSKEWSDHRVSQYLQVPRAWVETVRSEMFGPLATNPETHQLITEVDEKLAELRDVYEEVNKIKKKIDGFMADHGPALARASKAMDGFEELQKRVNEIRKRGM